MWRYKLANVGGGEGGGMCAKGNMACGGVGGEGGQIRRGCGLRGGKGEMREGWVCSQPEWSPNNLHRFSAGACDTLTKVNLRGFCYCRFQCGWLYQRLYTAVGAVVL